MSADNLECYEDFSSSILFDNTRIFVYVGSPNGGMGIRHRAKSAWIHPNYTVPTSILYLLILFNFTPAILQRGLNYFFRLLRHRAALILQFSSYMSHFLLPRRSDPSACPRIPRQIKTLLSFRRVGVTGMPKKVRRRTINDL